MNERRYPVGIQTFSEIITKGMVYVDKIDIVWQQIDSNSYAIPYKADGHRVVKIGVCFNVDTRVPEEWEIAE